VRTVSIIRMMMEVVLISETSFHFSETTRRSILEDCHLQSLYCCCLCRSQTRTDLRLCPAVRPAMRPNTAFAALPVCSQQPLFPWQQAMGSVRPGTVITFGLGRLYPSVVHCPHVSHFSSFVMFTKAEQNQMNGADARTTTGFSRSDTSRRASNL
jgi:hypothetical protein